MYTPTPAARRLTAQFEAATPEERRKMLLLMALLLELVRAKEAQAGPLRLELRDDAASLN